ncbi:tetratricopeptide repeat protein [Streptomyces sp. NPDC090022]|uniref:tetratricopeptide repeat protein n=1 Tax=Streptomyces sp. NPDC090022 TaxID=3365920 RepID=UPI00382CBC92
MSTMTPDEIRRGFHENRQLPGGATRNAHAESLTAAAEATGDRQLFREALDHQIDAYEYSAERTRLLVPFARLLQEYDRDPGAFSDWETHSLFWQFKWVASAINSSPELSLETARGWLADMERRYRLAGYNERPVRKAELFLAEAAGDDEGAERAMTRWTAADRDSMSDCHACELNAQGWFWARHGEDAKAVEVWNPVLAGDHTCAEEPHRVLAQSLLPLVRLGRLDEARSHHLRGYRMARGNESLLRSIGHHIEFCALTGNEARGLEILAEHAAHLGPLVDLDARLSFYGGVLVLLRRLSALGYGDRPTVAFEGTPRTADELYAVLHTDAMDIARRFDVRNGNPRVSQRLTDRVGREPLLAVLPLGVRVAAMPPQPGAGAATVPAPRTGESAAAGAAAAEDFAGLVARARTARAQGHPQADELWEQVGRRAETEPGEAVDAALTADLLEHRVLAAARAGDPTVRERFALVRDAQRAAGQEERAVLAQLRLATAALQFGAEPQEARALLAEAAAAAQALGADEPMRARRIATAELTRIRAEAHLASASGEADETGEDGTAAALAGFVAAYGADPDLADLVLDAEELLAHLVLHDGDAERGETLLASAAARGIAAGRPWLAVDPLAQRGSILMRLGRPAEAEEAVRAALAHAGEVTDAETQGAVRLTLCAILLERGDTAAEAAELALESAHWFDQAGLAESGGAQARLRLARAYGATGRTAEAVEVLQSALPDLLEHGEHQAVFARELLGGLLNDVNDRRGAAEQYLLAAETAKGWDDPRPQAGLAQSAADALSSAGMTDEARAAYERALELRRATGDAPVATVRMLRSLAWLELREDVDNARVAAARTRMDEAVEVLETALAAPDSGEAGAGAEAEAPLRYELAQTWQQLGRVLDQRIDAFVEYDDYAYDEDDEDDEDGDGEDGGATPPEPLTDAELLALRRETVALWDRAAGLYAGLGPGCLEERLQCLHAAAWNEGALGDLTAAVARIGAVLDEVRALPEGAAPDWALPRAEHLLASLNERLEAQRGE